MPIVEGDKTQLQSTQKKKVLVVCPWAVDSAWLVCGENAATATAGGKTNTSVLAFDLFAFALWRRAAVWCCCV